MGHVNDAGSGSRERVLGDGGDGQPGAYASLHAQIAALQQEVDGLRDVARQKAVLEVAMAQLREANQNLVLATVGAETRRDDALEVNRRQTEFLAMLAHELRNPLAPIATAAALIARMGDAAPQTLSLSQVIGRQVEHMSHLLDDLLDAARVSSGKITLSLQAVPLREIVEQAVETVAPRVRERGQQLTVSLPDPAVALHGDKVRLTQVLTNLLANASKYTQEGGALRLAVVPDAEQVTVTVEDNGTGIAPELLPRIFDLFTQGQRSLARSEGGLGVGLSVVRNLVDMHGGQVTAWSDGPGLGSCFTVVLPLTDEALASRKTQRPAARAATGLSLLVVEDNADACETLRLLLALDGHEVTIAHDGKAGLAAAQGKNYDALICDIGLPGLNGLELIAQLRRGQNGARPYAIALSGYCQAEDRSRALEAGFDSYCVKPVSAQALLAMLASSRERRSPA
jgi:signal transduction histidine kinase/ActR/RegA family two-component response regulator